MKMTFKKGINAESLILKHNILLQASDLVMGREGTLQTEKDLYLMMAFVNNYIEEDLIAECNEDERDLSLITIEDIEPAFNELMKDEKNKALYNEVHELFLGRCKEIWDNQHSFYGVLDALLTMIGSMDEEGKKEILAATGKIAEQAFDSRTDAMTKKVDETNSKLEQLVQQYMKNPDGKVEEKPVENKESDAE